MTSNEIKNFIQQVFQQAVEDMNATEVTYSKYFSKDYIQHVDGKKLTYSDFVAHMKTLKSVMKSIKVTFKYLLAEGDKVATVHLIDGVKKDGSIVRAQVNALFQISANKIVLCDELTRLIQGDESDEDLSSRH